MGVKVPKSTESGLKWLICGVRAYDCDVVVAYIPFKVECTPFFVSLWVDGLTWQFSTFGVAC